MRGERGKQGERGKLGKREGGTFGAHGKEFVHLSLIIVLNISLWCGLVWWCGVKGETFQSVHTVRKGLEVSLSVAADALDCARVEPDVARAVLVC